ncbi:MAG: response regulator [Oryzomonas sp.]|uniref:response regulator n=1 Tax=Oryzomonas sp. TaxID=2855186 RepID=UPI0028497E45|nr:response regulator [Oryzomonas sp.]MDR3581354.1 response regulator [Oryzomonas sp.]
MSSSFDAINEDNTQCHYPFSASENGAPLRILLVDDQELNRTLVASMLKDMGYSLEVSENGKEAVSKWENGSFDLILMDINMPIIDGIEAPWIIRNHEKDRGDYTPIIAFSADFDKEDSGEYSSLGFDGFVRKPLILPTLIQEINRCIPLRRPKLA